MKSLEKFPIFCAIVYIFTVLNAAGILGKKSNFCYHPTFVKTSWTDRRPQYVVNMTFHPGGSLSSEAHINEEVRNPVAMIAIISRDLSNGNLRTMYNVTSKVCEFQSFVEKIPMFKEAMQSSLKESNYSFECPMKPGVYVMRGIHLKSRSPLYTLLYRPKTSYLFHGGLFDQLPNGTLLSMSTYDIEVKVLKSDCGKP